MAGRCGHQTPFIVIDTATRTTFVQQGAIREWGIARAAWKQSLDSLEFTTPRGRGVVVSVLEYSTRSDVIQLTKSLFQQFSISGLFVTNVWVPIVLGHGNTTGIAVHLGDTACSVAPVIDLFVLHEAMTVIPSGVNSVCDDQRATLLEVRPRMRSKRLLHTS
jgi:actin-related protein